MSAFPRNRTQTGRHNGAGGGTIVRAWPDAIPGSKPGRCLRDIIACRKLAGEGKWRLASIFLSYARDDAAKARRLAETLEAAGHIVWWDQRIDAGSAFSAEIERALRDADLVVVLWSRASAKSPWVQDEAAAGRDRGRLVPVLLEEVAPPLGFRQYQAIDLSAWTGRGTARGLKPLLDAIERRATAGEPTATESETPVQGLAAKRTVGARTMVAIALAAIMLIAAYAYWSSRDSSLAPSVVVTAAAGPRAGDSQEFARNIAVELGRFRAGPLGSLTVLRDGGKGAIYRVEVGLNQSSGNVRADISLAGAKGSQILWSTAIDGPTERIVDIKQQSAAQLGSVLSCAVELGPRRERIKPDILGLYLSGCSELTDNVMDQTDRGAASIFRQITVKQPDFAPAWAYLALIESNSILSAPIAERPAIVRSAKADLERARRLDPGLEQVFAAEVLTMPYDKGRWAAALAVVERGLANNPESALLHSVRSAEMIKRGRMNEAVESARRSVEINPLAPAIRDDLILEMAFAGRPDAAARELQELARIWPGSAVLTDAQYRFNLRFGDPAVALAIIKDRAPEDPNVKFLEARIAPTPANIEAAIAAQYARFRRDQGVGGLLQALSTFDRIDEAYRILEPAQTLEGLMYGTEILFRPAMRSFRADPRFMVLTKRLGLLDYWRDSGDWPDFCADPQLPYDCKAEAAKLAAARP